MYGRRRKKIEPKYKTEADLCSDLIARARTAGFTVYPETGGWDLLLVRHGIQIGVQAKLKFTTHLIAQALYELVREPHYRAIACPLTDATRADALTICLAAKLVLLDLNCEPHEWLQNQETDYKVPGWPKPRHLRWRRYRRRPHAIVWLPPGGTPDLPAGVPSPSVVGAWQIAAARLEWIFHRRGWVTSRDARRVIESVQEKWNPGTLLKHFYTCTADKDPRFPRLRKWVIRQHLHVSASYKAARLLVKSERESRKRSK